MSSFASSLQRRGEDVGEADIGGGEVAGQALSLLEAMVGELRISAACAGRVSGGMYDAPACRTILERRCPRSRRGG